jgi:S-(hydroxymethyl)mycothiol dehydrogenase
MGLPMEPRAAQAVVVHQPGAAPALEEILLDPPGPGEVLVRVVATGVCHTDLHAQRGQFTPDFPILLGHEASGIVEAVGPGVTRPAVGESVVLTWRAPCGECRACVAGRPVRCVKPAVAGPRMRTRGGQPLARVLGLGTFATHTVVHAAQAIPVAADLAPEATCLLGCGVATGVGAVLFAARMPPGATAAVIGCGAVGASVIMGARLAHAARIVAVDLSPARLEAARHLGATDAVLAGAGDTAKEIRKLTGGGVAWAYEAVGAPETLAMALGACEQGGTCVLIGVPVPGAELRYPMAKLFYSRLTLLTTFGGDALPARDFPLLADWYRRGDLPLDALVTARGGLGDVAEAFAAMTRGEGLRTVLTP